MVIGSWLKMEKTVLVIFVVATILQLGLWLFFYSRVAFFNGRKGAEAAKNFSKTNSAASASLRQNSLSVLICARNEAENLKKNLPFILAQTFPDFEIIVVNDASTDETAAVLADFQLKNSRLRVISSSEKKSPGKKTALAEAIRAAKNDRLVLTDADCRPASPRWLEHMAAEFSDEKQIVLGFSPYRREPGFLNAWIQFEACWTAVQYVAAARAGIPYMGVGRNLAYSKRLFEQAGGFQNHADLPSGDDDLFISAAANGQNTAVCLDPDSFVFSKPNTTWAAYVNQKKRHFTTGHRYRPAQKWLLAIAALSHGCHYLLAAGLLFTNCSMMFVLMCYVVRIMVVSLFWTLILRKFQALRLLPILPLLDFGLILHHLVFSPVIFFSSNNKPVSWK